MIRTIFLVALLLPAACLGGGGSPVEVSGSCIAVLNVEGALFTPGDGAVFTADVAGEYLEVTRDTGCLDTGQRRVELGPGESNFLPVGTRVHRVAGFAPGERLTWWSAVAGAWLPLAPVSER